MARKRILFVDDDHSVLKTVGKRLEVSGFEVMSVAEGAQALTKARTERPDLIVLDLVLQDTTGFEICAQLKQDPQCQSIPVVIFTGKGDEGDEERCRELGATYVLQRHGTGMLLEQIRKLLGQG